MRTIDNIREMVMDICKEVMDDHALESWQLEEWLEENAKWRTFCEDFNGKNVEFDMDMKVRDLKIILNRIEDDDMDIIIPVLDPEDTLRIHGFRHVRTAGILSNKFEEKEALCLSAPGHGKDMFSQLDYNHMSHDTICKQQYF